MQIQQSKLYSHGKHHAQSFESHCQPISEASLIAALRFICVSCATGAILKRTLAEQNRIRSLLQNQSSEDLKNHIDFSRISRLEQKQKT